MPPLQTSDPGLPDSPFSGLLPCPTHWVPTLLTWPWSEPAASQTHAPTWPLQDPWDGQEGLWAGLGRQL